MKNQLTEQDIITKYGDYKTVFEIITDNQTSERFIHYLGYCYYADSPIDKPYRHVEYCGFYVNIYEVLYKGLNAAERDNIDLAKEYIKDICYEEILQIYNNWIGDGNGGSHPPILLKLEDFTDKTPDGIYILENE